MSNLFDSIISKGNFKPVYEPGEKIQTPYYMAEMELLDKKDGVFYILYIRQQKQ